MAVTKAVIPAAGLGTRFLPATKAQPKEMLPVIDKPAIQYVVEEAVSAGVTDIVVVTRRGKHTIEDHFDRSFDLEAALQERGDTETLDSIRQIDDLARIHYVRQHEQRGLGHAILQAAPLIGDEPFVVLLPDNIFVDPLIEPMIRVYDELGRSVIAFQEVPMEHISFFGAAATEPMSDRLLRIVDIVEKPKPEEAPSNLAVIGRYLFTPEIFEVLRHTQPGAGGEIQVTDAIRSLALAQAVYGYVYEGRWYDVGRKLDFLRATVEMAAERDDLSKEFLEFLADFAIRRKLV